MLFTSTQNLGYSLGWSPLLLDWRFLPPASCQTLLSKVAAWATTLPFWKLRSGVGSGSAEAAVLLSDRNQ